jgi:hypothetical protein
MMAIPSIIKSLEEHLDQDLGIIIISSGQNLLDLDHQMLEVAIDIMVEMRHDRGVGLTKGTGGSPGRDLIHPRKGGREGTK